MKDLLGVIWFCAILTRGINSIYDFSHVYKRIVFITVYTWTFIFAWFSGFIIDDFVFKLLK